MNIFNTMYGQAVDLRTQSMQALPFLITNQNGILVNEADLKDLELLRGHGASTIISLYHKLLETRKGFGDFAVMNLKGVKDSIPDAVTVDAYSIDGSILAGVPPKFAKQWINLTPVMKRRTSPNVLMRELISDIPRTCGLFVRGGLCNGYHEACSRGQDWLSLNLAKFIVESYSMSVAMLVQRLYNLDWNDTRLVAIVFAFFYANLQGRKFSDTIPPVLNRCTSLGNIGDITASIGEIKRQFPDGTDLNELSISELCTAIPKLGAGRLEKFTFHNLRQIFTRNPQDSFAMSFAMDYPPYWVFQLLKQMSGAVNPVVRSVMNIPSFKKESSVFAVELERHTRLFG